MNPQAEELNLVIREKNQVLYDMLSERGKNIFFPKKGILGQTAEAKGTKINATIGTAVEDDGSPMRLESIASKINLDPSLTFPYAPSFGRPDLRARWKSMLYEKNPSLGNAEISLPVVCNALTHGISMAAYMFLDEGDNVLVSDLYWGNYNLTFTNMFGAGIVKFNLFKDNHFDLESFENTLNEGPVGKRAVILNFPNNPTGYSPTYEENKAIANIIKKSADKGNRIVVMTDDAYFGLVFENGIATESTFSLLANLHENVLAVKIDGATKEDYVWGFRVGFITYGIKGGDAALYNALESKTAGAIRGNISNSANISQSLVLSAFNSPDYAKQKQEKFDILKHRYETVKEVLKDEKYKAYFEALPFNSGYFMCVRLADGLSGEQVRQHLIKNYSIGTISLNNLIRIAFSAVAAKDIKELFEGLYQTCRELKK